jgi:uncharacterized protein (DUF1015 family)
MADIAPFKALRYNPGVVGELSAVVAPPYDVITPEARKQYARHPLNVVHLTLPDAADPGPAVADAYQRAGTTFADWRARGVLVRDDEAALYPYEQEFSLEGGARLRRRGFLGLVRLAEYEERSVLPHERTFARYKDDRLRLMRACPANLEPILAFYRAPAAAVGATLAAAMGGPPLACVRDGEGTCHRLWRLPAAAVPALTAPLTEGPVAIADGHHRYETALNFRNERLAGVPPGETRGRPEAFVLAHLVEAGDAGLLILPTHRVVRRAPAWPALRSLLGTCFEVQPVPPSPAGALETLRAELRSLQSARGVGTAFLALGPGPEILRLRLRGDGPLEELRAAGHSTAYARLDVAVLHALVLERLLGLAPGDPDAVVYERDERRVLSAVLQGEAGLAFCLSAPRPVEVLQLAQDGERMPQKSTYFYPKVLSGLVLHPLDVRSSDETPLG